MRPVPIPDLLVRPDQRRVVIGAPNGSLIDSLIAPVEAIVEDFQDSRLYSVRVELEDGDLAELQSGDHIWIKFWGVVPPFDVGTGP